MAPLSPQKSINMGNISTASLIANNPGVAQPATRKPVAFNIDPQELLKPVIPLMNVIKTPTQSMKPMSQELPVSNPKTLPNGQPIMASNVSSEQLKTQPSSKYLTKDKVKSILMNAPSGVDKSTLLDDIVGQGYIVEGYNDAQAQITQAPVPVAPQISYGENKLQDQKQPGSLRRGIASLGGDLGDAERLNPIGKLTEIIDNSMQKIPTFNTEDWAQKRIDKKIKSLSPQEVNNYQKRFNESKSAQKLFGNLENFIREKESNLIESIAGGGVKDTGGPNVPSMIANVPGSLLKTTSATARGITNPVDTMQGLYKLVATDEGQQVIKDRYGSIDNFANSMDQDPVGVASDILTVVQGGAGIASKGARLAGATQLADDAARLSAQAGGAADLGLGVGMNKLNAGIGNIASKPLRIAAKTALAPTQPLVAGKEVLGETKKALQGTPGEVSFVDRAISAYNGLDSETVRQMKDQPDIVKALDEGKITKESIKSDLVDAVDQSLGQKKDVGSQYQDVYKNNTRYNANEIIDDINRGLTDQGVMIKGGKITGFDTTKMTGLTDQAKSALKSKYEDTISTLKSKKDIGVEDLHNIRKDLYSTSYQDGFMTKKAPGVSKVSDIINERLKKIPGFEAADAGFKEAADLAKEIKDNVINKDGDFKGTLKALLGERGSKRMDILDKHFPGLKDKIKTLAAYDDYLNTRNRKKVGMYEKAGTAGAAALGGFALGGPLLAVVTGIAGPMLSDFIRDPKWFKNYIISKAGKEVASKIELGTPLNIAEKTRLNRIMSELEKDPQKALPYKPDQATPVTPDGKAVVSNPLSPKPTAKQIIEKISTQAKMKPKTSIVPKSEGPLIKGVPELGSNQRPIITPQTFKQGVAQKTTIEKGVAKQPGTTKDIVAKLDQQIRAKKQGETPVKTVPKTTNTKVEPKKATVDQELQKVAQKVKEKRLVNDDLFADLGDARAEKAYSMVNKTNIEIRQLYNDGKLSDQDVKDIVRARQANAQLDYVERGIVRSNEQNQSLLNLVKEKSIAKKEKGSIMDGMKTTIADQIKEAKASGKTFDEFIASKEKNGEILYHGTNAKFDEFDNKKSMSDGDMGRAIYLSSKPETIYGDTIMKSTVELKNPVYVGGENNTDLLKEFKGKDAKDLVRGLDLSPSEASEIANLVEGNSIYKEFDTLKLKKSIKNQESVRTILERLGFDGVIDSTVSDRFTYQRPPKGTIHTILFDPKKINTEAQLKAERDKLSPKSDTPVIPKDLKPLYDEAKKIKKTGK